MKNWLSRLQRWRDQGSSGAVDQVRLHCDLSAYAVSNSSMGIDIIDPASSDAENMRLIACLSTFARNDVECVGSLIVVEHRRDFAAIVNSLVESAGRCVEMETGRRLTALDMAMQRSTPLLTESPLADGRFTIHANRVNAYEGRYELKWVSNEDFEAGRLSDENHVVVAALDVVRDEVTESGESHALHGRLSVFQRLDGPCSSPCESAWAHFDGELRLPKMANLQAIEAMHFPQFPVVVANTRRRSATASDPP